MIVRMTQRCRFNFFFILISVRSTRIVHKYLCYSKINVLLICRNLCRSFMLFDYNIFWSERDNTNIKRISKHFKLTWTLLMHTCCAKPFLTRSMLTKSLDNSLFYPIFIKSEYTITIANVETCSLDIEFCILYFTSGIAV